MDGPPPEVRERRPGVGPRGGGHRDDVREIVAGGVERRGVIVRRLVPRRGNEEDPARSVSLDGVEQGLGKPSAAPTVAGRYDVDPSILHELDIFQAVDRIVSRTGPRGVQELARHDADGPVDANDPDAVVPDRPDRARDMGAVGIVVHRVGVIVEGVDTEAVVDVTVAVVIDSVTVAILRVAEHVRGQVLVRVVDSRVEHGHDDVAAPGAHVPGSNDIDVCMGHPAARAGIGQSPEIAEAWIVGSGLALDDPVRLRIDDIGRRLVEGEGFFDIHPGRKFHRVKAVDEREILVRIGTDERVSERLVFGPGRCLEPHEDGVWRVAEQGLGDGA